MPAEKQTKAELQEELADLGQDTEGSKAELEDRLEDVKEDLGLITVIEGDPKVLKENEKLAEKLAKEAHDSPAVPDVFEARKTD